MASRRQRKANRRSTRRQSGGVTLPSFSSLFRRADPLTATSQAEMARALAAPRKSSISNYLPRLPQFRASIGAAGTPTSVSPVTGASSVAGSVAGAPAPGAAVAGAAPAAGSGASSAPAPGTAAPAKTGSSWRSYLPSLARQPAVDPTLKTSTGLFKSVVEDVNWVRANSKNIIKGAQAGKEVWAKGKAGINQNRAGHGLPATYSNMEFNDYDPDEYKNLKKNGKWFTKFGELTPKPGHGRFYGRDYTDLQKTIASFKESYKKKRNSNYTRRWDEHEKAAKIAWETQDKKARDAVDADLRAMDADYKNYAAAVKARIDTAYIAQKTDFLKKSRVARQKAADDFAVTNGYTAPKIKMNGNNSNLLTKSFKNSMIEASAMDPSSVSVKPLDFLISAETAAAARAPLIQAARNAAAAAAAAAPTGAGTSTIAGAFSALTGAAAPAPAPVANAAAANAPAANAAAANAAAANAAAANAAAAPAPEVSDAEGGLEIAESNASQ